MKIEHTYPQLARRHVSAEERDPGPALLVRPSRRNRQLPLYLDPIWSPPPPGDFGQIARVAAHRLQSPVQDRGQGRRGMRRAEERICEPAVLLVRPRVVVARMVGWTRGRVMRLRVR